MMRFFICALCCLLGSMPAQAGLLRTVTGLSIVGFGLELGVQACLRNPACVRSVASGTATAVTGLASKCIANPSCRSAVAASLGGASGLVSGALLNSRLGGGSNSQGSPEPGVGHNGAPPDPPMNPKTAAATILAWAALPTDNPKKAQKISEIISRELPNATERQAKDIFELSRDPDKGGLNPSEAETGIRLQKVIGSSLRRSGPGADYIDSSGTVYDAMGNFPESFLNEKSFEGSLMHHYTKQGVDKIVVDVTGWSQRATSQVEAMIARQTSANQARTMLLK